MVVLSDFPSPDYTRAIFGVVPTILAECFKLEIEYPYEKYIIRQRGLRNKFKESDIAIVVIFDAIGSHNIRGRFRKLWLERGGRTLSSIFPTLTAPAIVSIYTGVPPELHGIPSMKIYIKEIGNYVDTIRGRVLNSSIPLRRAGVDLESFLWTKPVLSVARGDVLFIDFLPYWLIKEGGLRDFYGKYLYPIGFDGHMDAIYTLKRLLEYLQNVDTKALIFIYFGFSDSFGEDHGVEVDGWGNINDNAYEISACILQLMGKLRKKTSVFIISDHGLVGLKEYVYISDEDIDKLKENGADLFAKCGRFASIFVKEDNHEQVKECLADIFGGRATIIDTDKCLRHFWPDVENVEGFIARLGKMIVLPDKNIGIIRVGKSREEETIMDTFYRDLKKPRGSHGGASKEEFEAIFIPLTDETSF